MRRWLVTTIGALGVVLLAASCSDDGTTGPKNDLAVDTAKIDSTQADLAQTADQSISPDQAAATDFVGESLPACPIEKDLTSYVPCDCYGTLVTDIATAIPGCTSTVKCCPAKKGLVCE